MKLISRSTFKYFSVLLIFVVMFVLGRLSRDGFKSNLDVSSSDVSSTLKINYSSISDIVGRTSIGCESLISSDIVSSPGEWIRGNLRRGTDKIAIKIKDDKTLTFITQAAVGIGEAEGASFLIMKNTDKDLMAISYDDYMGVNVFALNKENGLAVWSKAKSRFLMYGPMGEVIYLVCR